MMGTFFLGKWWHWLLLAVMVGLLWLAGSHRLHVVDFNTFILSLTGGVIVAVGRLLGGTRPGEQVTRDPIEAGEETGPEASQR